MTSNWFKLIMKAMNVQYGKNLILKGAPLIYNKRGAVLTIGDNCTIKSSFLFTDTLENKIDYLVNTLNTKKFKLYVHPYVAAYINQGFISLYRRWQLKYGFGFSIIPSQQLGFLQYIFKDREGNELNLTEEIETK